MLKPIENGLALIEKWLRNKNTIEFLGIWEEIYNPNFNCTEFGTIRNAAGSNNFVQSVKFMLSLAFFCFLTEIIWWNHYYFVFLHR